MKHSDIEGDTQRTRRIVSMTGQSDGERNAVYF